LAMRVSMRLRTVRKWLRLARIDRFRSAGASNRRLCVARRRSSLGRLPGAGFRYFAVPVKVKGMGTFPARAFGLVDEPA
jgi:hypothetical protein